MIDLETIEREISELEVRQPSYRACERLAWLYIVRDHLIAANCPKDGGGCLKSPLSGSEFLELCNDVPHDRLLRVIDEHLQSIRLLYPKSYDAIMRKIRDLR